MSRSTPQINPGKPLGGRYRITKQLGIGGFGRTFLAEDLHLPGYPRCVIKQLRPQRRSEDTMQMARRCFNTEAQVLYQLGSHSQIPRLLAHFEDNQEFYLAQEFIEGDPLTQELIEGKPWSQGQVVALLKDVLQILSFVHEQQVIHRDIKPSNLIRRQDGRIVLIDFGAVKQVSTQTFNAETGMTDVTISIGTQGYMPNEQMAGKPRYSSDIYAVGVIGIQALTGIHPKHFIEDASGEIEWHHRAPDVHPALKALLDCMVRYDFRARYQTAIAALTDLETLPTEVTECLTPLPFVPDPNVIGPVALETAAPSTQPHPDSSPFDLTAAGEFEASDGEPLSTAIWSQSDSPPQSATRNGTGLTQAIGRPHLPDVDSEPATAAPETRRQRVLRRLKSVWLLLAIVALSGVGAVVAARVLPQLQPNGSNQGDVAPNPSLSPTPNDPSQQAASLVQQGEKLKSTQQLTAALKLYDQAIALRPDFAEAYQGRCDTLNRLKRPEEAIVSCNDALAYRPNYPEAIWNKGNALMQQNRIFEALRLYEDVTFLKPDYAPGWVKRGVALQKLGRSAEALDSLDRGIQIQRNSLEAWITRGAALINLQRYDEAIVSLDKALQLSPGNAEATQLRQQAQQRGK